MARKKPIDTFRLHWERSRPRRTRFQDRPLFEIVRRGCDCLKRHRKFAGIVKLDEALINRALTHECSTIEEQMVCLRQKLQLTRHDIESRIEFTACLLDCLKKHHGTVYQGVLFGSTSNGLGHRDSDVDLRLRVLNPAQSKSDIYEPITECSDMIERRLRNIAYTTTTCYPAVGEFVPSFKCPLAKLKFLDQINPTYRTFEEGLSYDISLSSAGSNLGSLNTKYLRFLCKLEPKFHILALALRHWAKTQKLIQPGLLSSYALINMLIFFCQSTTPRLLPTVNEMREMYFKHDDKLRDTNNNHRPGSCRIARKSIALTQVESQCLICMHQECYSRSENKEPTSLLMLKFFEFYLRFPYSTHIITTRPGHALTVQEFRGGSQYNPSFPIKKYLNIQDPFDMRHNLTAGMEPSHLYRTMITIQVSYEILAQELSNDLNLSGLNGKKLTVQEPDETSSDHAIQEKFKKATKRVKNALYTPDVPLKLEHLRSFLDTCRPFVKGNHDFDKLERISQGSRDEYSNADQEAIKHSTKLVLRIFKANIKPLSVRNSPKTKSAWGLIRIFDPLVSENLKLPKTPTLNGKNNTS